MRAAPHLQPPDFSRLLDLALRHETLEFAAAENVGPFTDHHRACAFVDHQSLDAGDDRSLRPRNFTPLAPCRHRGQRLDVRRRRPAASPNQVDPSGLDETFELARKNLRRFVVMPLFVGQSGVGHACDRDARYFTQRPQMVGHEVRTRRTIESDPHKVEMRDRGVKRFDVLPGEQSTHRLDRTRHRNRCGDPRLLACPLDSSEPGLAIEGILYGFEQ